MQVKPENRLLRGVPLPWAVHFLVVRPFSGESPVKGPAVSISNFLFNTGEGSRKE